MTSREAGQRAIGVARKLELLRSPGREGEEGEREGLVVDSAPAPAAALALRDCPNPVPRGKWLAWRHNSPSLFGSVLGSFLALANSLIIML